ncbi:leucyl/phenylalanyl-tRNA--protein transferase [Aliigemmobacter aestuarii]|uniref:Leucyl/phenylalanyl-tRNA--protein transferase n=1 Tax=Aliigemmobacter aestuarii TaxID=1445661 RepID=A0A4S3MM94_9RHOB|nr:leucyl/phenylalanyl-tRNA--protein transferase [Gemmobacter aestuarii]THD83175.1 leucyl/phenylalanyl-tRNA--protein transferase [Gemmobacter aestuarii]
MDPDPEITPDILLRAYAMGIFPMAESRDDPAIHWVDPRRRGVFPLDGFHISRSLARRIRRGGYEVSADTAFDAVVSACAAREETWINDRIHGLYADLHRMGFAHSLEIRIDGELAGGVYGVTLGAAFFGESMFSHRTDASKLALTHLVARLRRGGFTLFDTQFLTPHLASLGAIEITRADYHRRLRDALLRGADFGPPGRELEPLAVA